jgi:hypothetical protein
MESLKVYMAKYHSGAAAYPDGSNQGEGKIRCSHLLVKHRDSRRPSSWREATITRTKEEAREILRGHQQRIISGEITLGDLAMAESDCSSARKKGDLYVFALLSCSLSILSNLIADVLKVASSVTAKCKENSKRQRLPCSQARSVTLSNHSLVFISSSGMLK